jgi:hypothetical protein
MRELTSHKVTGVNDGITLSVVDEPGHGGANHDYTAEWVQKDGRMQCYRIKFQNGTLPEVGVNGLTHEVLLSILIDRLEGFQRGKFVCWNNALALDHLREAQRTLLERTKERLARGVEGIHKE